MNPFGRLLEKRNQRFFNMKIGLNFLDDEYDITVFKHLNTSDGIKVRAVNMLGEYQLHGIILSKKRINEKGYYSAVERAFSGFIESRRQKGISEKTLQSNELYLSRFSEYLAKQKLEDVSELNASHILSYVNTLAGISKATAYCTLCSLRVLFRYLYEEKFLEKDYSYVVPKLRIDKTSKIPSAYNKEEVQKLLNSVDRGNPKGKRDYAMLILASKLGMRAGDICSLSFKNLKWEYNEIEFIQEKTQKKIVMPLLSEVGSAIINYLKYGRPVTDSETIFVRHTCPITPLTPPTLHSIVCHYMQLAGINVPDGKKHGPHALRHSLASALLEENIPLPVISEVLGHTAMDTTSIYLKIDVNHLRHCAIEDFLNWMERERKCSVSTRNQRLAAIHAFFKHLQLKHMHALYHYQQILAIPMKKTRNKSITYLSLDSIKRLLNMPDKTTKNGRRDLVLLSLLYESGARVQEIADLRVGDVRLHHPAIVKITGKGNKTRIVPIMEPMARLIEQYIKENKLNLEQCNEYPLFCNSEGKKLSRSGISYIVKKYFSEAKKLFPGCYSDTISPHVMRHSKAMHLLHSGVNLVYIRDLLGHVSIKTTEVYARADTSTKRKALEKAYVDVVSDELPQWQQDTELLEWLKNLGR